jgi:thioredoxin-dependent peroxiredoxin
MYLSAKPSLQSIRPKKRPNVGDPAPDFELLAQDGRKISLHDFFDSKRNIVLYFYPKDFTPGCTAETKQFGESYGAIQKLDAEILGVSSDDVSVHKEFARECGAAFPLLSDADGEIAKLYGVEKSFGLLPGRTTFVIDRHGIIRHIFSSQLRAKAHIAEAMRALSQIADTKD